MATVTRSKVYNLQLSETEARYLEYFLHYALVDEDDEKNEPAECEDGTVHEGIYNAIQNR